MRKILFILTLGIAFQVKAQELNCLVIVNADQIQNTNSQIYTTLQNSIMEYMNNTKWTNQDYKPQERIECAITLMISEQPSTNTFKGSIQIQASRPVYNSTYKTPTLNFNDNNLAFDYTEFESLDFNENSFESNLVSILTFYAYTILGIDADTFSQNGGDEYHRKAENIVNLAQQSGYSGWNRIDGNQTRYQLNENMLSSSYQDFRDVLYAYHRNGLDTMSENKKEAKKNIGESLKKLESIYKRRANAYLLRVFMDTKSDEISEIFSDGPRVNNAASLKEMLLKIYPTLNEKWDKIKI